MRVLVTWATGFIGSHLCRALSAAWHQVSALTRDPDAARRRLPALSAAYRWEPPGNPPPVEALAVDAVINLAGESPQGRWTDTKKRQIRDSRVLGTPLLVEAMRSASQRPTAFVSASASGYYGDRRDEALTEESNPGNGFLAGVCKEWEHEADQSRFGKRAPSASASWAEEPTRPALLQPAIS